MRDFEQDRKICEAATPGEWRIGKYGQCVIADSEYGTHTDKGAAEYYGGNLVCESTYPQNATFIAAAREGWPAALDRIAELERQLQAAANMEACEGRCPDVSTCPTDVDCVECWVRYWRKCAATPMINSDDNGGNSKDKAANSKDSGTFQNGNNHKEASK